MNRASLLALARTPHRDCHFFAESQLYALQNRKNHSARLHRQRVDVTPHDRVATECQISVEPLMRAREGAAGLDVGMSDLGCGF